MLKPKISKQFRNKKWRDWYRAVELARGWDEDRKEWWRVCNLYHQHIPSLVLCILVGSNPRESTSVEAKTGSHYA